MLSTREGDIGPVQVEDALGSGSDRCRVAHSRRDNDCRSLAAFGIARNERWDWGLGTAVAGGAVLAYLITRTLGLPGFRENSWASFAEPMAC